MAFRVEFEEWTGSEWLHRESDPLSEDDALYWFRYLHHQNMVEMRQATLKSTA